MMSPAAAKNIKGQIFEKLTSCEKIDFFDDPEIPYS